MLAKLNVVELPVPAATVYAVHDHPDAARHIRRATNWACSRRAPTPKPAAPVFRLQRPAAPDPTPAHRRRIPPGLRRRRPIPLRIWVTPTPPAADPTRHDLARAVGRGAPAGGGRRGAGIARESGTGWPGCGWRGPGSRTSPAGRSDPDVWARTPVRSTTWGGPTATGSRARRWPRTSRRCGCTGMPATVGTSGHPPQHRPRVPRVGGAAAGAGLLPSRPCRSAGRSATGPAKRPPSTTSAPCTRVGDRQRALDYYQQALPIQREVGDRAGEAATLNNIGLVYDGLGEPERALDYYQAGAAHLPGGRRPGRRSRHPQQHRRRVQRAGGPPAGAGLLPAGAADPPAGRRPRRRSNHPQQHRRRVRTAGGPAAGAGLLRAGAADPPAGRRPRRRSRHPQQHRRDPT